MFERTKKINGHEYRYLVKSVRVDGKMKQKFIKYLGKVKVANQDIQIMAVAAEKAGVVAK